MKTPSQWDLRDPSDAVTCVLPGAGWQERDVVFDVKIAEWDGKVWVYDTEDSFTIHSWHRTMAAAHTAAARVARKLGREA